MNCRNHPERVSEKVCLICGGAFCDECSLELGDKIYCKNCVRQRIETETDSNRPGDEGKSESEQRLNERIVVGRVSERKNKFWAFLFSLIPGVGYLYLGLMNRGLQTMVVFFGSIFVASFMRFEEIMALILPVVMFYSIFDTQQLVRRLNEGYSVEDKQLFDIKKIPFNQAWIGYGLIFIGAIALLNNVIPYYFPVYGLIRKLLPPVLIIALGVFILRRSTQNKFE